MSFKVIKIANFPFDFHASINPCEHVQHIKMCTLYARITTLFFGYQSYFYCKDYCETQKNKKQKKTNKHCSLTFSRTLQYERFSVLLFTFHYYDRFLNDTDGHCFCVYYEFLGKL